MTKKVLTETQFQEAIKKLNVSQQTLEISRGVLVEGKTQTEYVKQFNLTRGAVSQTVKRIYSRAKVQMEGYEEVNVILPKYRAFIVKKWAAETQKEIQE